jgi:hypothetical protein
MGRGGRIVAALIALGCLSVLAVASWLEPAAEGVGTHEQIAFMDPCSFFAQTGVPCATCGMTTAYTHAAHGEWVASFVTQPLGFVLVLVTGGMVWLSGYAAVTGSRIAEAASGMMSQSLVWWAVGTLLAAWGWKIVSMGVLG